MGDMSLNENQNIQRTVIIQARMNEQFANVHFQKYKTKVRYWSRYVFKSNFNETRDRPRWNHMQISKPHEDKYLHRYNRPNFFCGPSPSKINVVIKRPENVGR